MKKLIVIFNHTLTARQIEDAYGSLGVGDIILPPDDLADLWQQVPSGLEKLDEYLQPLAGWLTKIAIESDYVLIQGEFGATFYLVFFALKHRFVPIYSTTRREALEEYLPGGEVEVKHRFRHVRFRKYQGVF